MTCKIYPTGSLKSYKYVVVLSEYQGKILLSRHKYRKTWETQGGHIEAGEQPLDAAKRELFEESGAVGFDIQPLCCLLYTSLSPAASWRRMMVSVYPRRISAVNAIGSPPRYIIFIDTSSVNVYWKFKHILIASAVVARPLLFPYFSFQ